MKSHSTKEECFAASGLPEDKREAFYAGWYAAGTQINNGLDSDMVQESLKAGDFLRPDPPSDAEERREPDATHFRVDDVWDSPAGTRYKVERVLAGVAQLRPLIAGKKPVWRAWDAIGAHSNRCWFRQSWGGKL